MTASAPRTRITATFERLQTEGRAALVTFLSAGDPDYHTSLALLQALPENGADIIEIGMPFSDPMADGLTIQLSSKRALKAGQTTRKTLEMVRHVRTKNDNTPIVLMGYFNPIYHYGVERFLTEASAAGVDGLIVVDLPPEEEGDLCLPARAAGIDFIYLTAPTTSDARLPRVLQNAGGFVYFVSITGITGTRSADTQDVQAHLARIRKQTRLPLAVGFGVRTPEKAAEIARIADAVVVGSALIDIIAENVDDGTKVLEEVSALTRALADAVCAVKK